MTHEQVEQWLRNEAAKKNSMAQTYLSLLENAAPEVREQWFTWLGTLLGAVEQNGDAIRNQLRQGK